MKKEQISDPVDDLEEAISTRSNDVAKDKKKVSYSKDLKNIQKAEHRLSKASRKIARSVEKGINSYLKQRDKSASKKKDGALEDLSINFSKGFADFGKAASPAFYDIGKAVNIFRLTKKQRKSVKRQIRSIGRMVPSPLGTR